MNRCCIIHILVYVLCVICMISCKYKSEQDKVKLNLETSGIYEPEFDESYQKIIYKEETEYDIKSEIIAFHTGDSMNPVACGIRYSFYNYGGDLRLLNGYRDDLFVIGLGEISYINHLSAVNIKIISTHKSKKYGDWAFVNIPFGNNILKNVFMTPLAMKAYKNNIRDNFILVVFVEKDKHMSVIFYGDSNDCLIVDNFSKNIMSGVKPISDIDSFIDGPGQFWFENDNQ